MKQSVQMQILVVHIVFQDQEPTCISIECNAFTAYMFSLITLLIASSNFVMAAFRALLLLTRAVDSKRVSAGGKLEFWSIMFIIAEIM